MLDLWRLFRFKQQDEQIRNNDVLVSNLRVMKEIEARVKDRTLDREDADKLKFTLAKNALVLINAHALPTEQLGVEIVDNGKLLEGFSSKMLPASTETIPEPETVVLNASIANTPRSKRNVPRPAKRTSRKKASK